MMYAALSARGISARSMARIAIAVAPFRRALNRSATVPRATAMAGTARRGTAANIFVNGSPQAYEVWLRGIVDATKRDLPAGERFLFINAWNEWAEGAHLEPDLKFGRAYLEATRRALTGTSDWQTLVDYASRRGELSGAVLADWLHDVGAVLKRQELSCQHLLRSQTNG